MLFQVHHHKFLHDCKFLSLECYPCWKRLLVGCRKLTVALMVAVDFCLFVPGGRMLVRMAARAELLLVLFYLLIMMCLLLHPPPPPGVRKYTVGEIESLICNFSLSVAAHKIVLSRFVPEIHQHVAWMLGFQQTALALSDIPLDRIHKESEGEEDYKILGDNPLKTYLTSYDSRLQTCLTS